MRCVSPGRATLDLRGSRPGDPQPAPVALRSGVDLEEQADACGIEELELAQIEHNPGGVARLRATHLAIDAADHREVQLTEEVDALVGACALTVHGEAPWVQLACDLIPL